ncbi:primosomal protein N' [Neobacillus sp. OS1-32]|jgi:primosomal protein N' (replication factor Y)|uniref:Replication restart protein PriA n=1 Tax=Neobacillus paridis TaxID=2803862 RepID=A0ABS1TMS1_9BACI|nr:MULTISPECIES: primosomal protein N' [Neobacillus]MBL4952629.1 primosomal protein N' [Neobacillus paridis]WML31860.1 primosomal protein N' [Neobacillus sp. OS1-32]
MKIASVIVDVPAKQTDKPFDYLIPEDWTETMQPGMRVIVPFGPRKIQGFVTEIKDKSEFKQLKEIIAPMDLEPVLNKELLHLGEWLTETSLCFKIFAYQAMLPAALKAKYEKKVRLAPGKEVAVLPSSLQAIFADNKKLEWEEVLKSGLVPLLQREAAKGHLEVVYEVKERVKKKQVKVIRPLFPPAEIKAEMERLPANAEKQRQVLDYFIEHQDPVEQKQLLTIVQTSPSTVKALVEKGLLSEDEMEVYRDPFENRVFEHTAPLPLTKAQTAAISPILKAIEAKRHEVFLLYGVTGSGKTEIYLQAIQDVIDKGKEAIVLVPEISLTPQMVNRFKGRFGDLVAVMHSGLSAGEKYDEWRKIQRKEVKVVVGARSAIFAPFENIGIIIIDEEHETSYKQEDMPRYHARDVAIERAKVYSCPVVLGSATPSLESFARAQKKVYHLLTLSNRMNNKPLPPVEIIDMREELRAENRSMFSRKLFSKLKDRLEKKQQSVLLLNKRGHSSFVMCRDCGYVVNCPNCDISLTYHRAGNRMKCHYCGYESNIPNVCPECSSEYIRYFGTGTQKVEEELGKILPEARVIRMDVDTTGRKGSHEKLLKDFRDGKADILLGTQMIAKGLDFPNITLVGVLSADTMLHLPDFRSSEKTFQLLTQVSGRAGRHQLPGEVVIQTYTPEHYSIELAGMQNYDYFYQREMMMRKIHHYPPFYYLVLVTVTHEQLMKAVAETEKIVNYLRSQVSNQAVILGPAASPIPRINNRYRYQCLIKYKREPNLTNVLKKILDQYQKEARNGLQVSIDVNPFILM